VAALVSAFIIRFIAPVTEASHFKIKMLLAVTIAGMGGMAIFLAVSSAFKIEEMRYFGKVMRKFKR
jgi:hypothetical protein